MLVDILRCNIFIDTDISTGQLGTPLYQRCRLVFLDGVCAVWREDEDLQTAQRLTRVENVTFSKRRRLRDPHAITFPDGYVWFIFESSGGCGCGSPLRNKTWDEMLAPELESVG